MNNTILIVILSMTALGHLTSAGFLVYLAKKKSVSIAKWGAIGLLLGLIGVALFFILEDKRE